MRVNAYLECRTRSCEGIDPAGCLIPDLDLHPESVSIVMISESAPPDPADHYYADGEPLFQQTTVQAFRDAEVPVASVRDILALGVYLTTAVKCPKIAYSLPAPTIDACSRLLERELALFPRTRAIMLMGDTAIKALNAIARRAGRKRVIPAGSTYKIRGGEYESEGRRVFPSYLQAGPAFFIEKSKRAMIAEDIRRALAWVR